VAWAAMAVALTSSEPAQAEPPPRYPSPPPADDPIFGDDEREPTPRSPGGEGADDKPVPADDAEGESTEGEDDRLAPGEPDEPAETDEPTEADEPTETVDPSQLAPIDVTVEGQKPMPPGRSAGQHTFKHREIERLPGAFGDGLRAVEVLPGVTPMMSGLPHFIVRGSVPSSTAYYLDGIRVPFLYHLGVGPSVVHSALVHGVDFYPGPYPAMYGGHVGGVLAAQTPPPAYRISGTANIRVFDASAFLEVPLLDGKADVFAAGRYSYTAAVLSLFTPGTNLSYWDYQAGGSVALSSADRLKLFVFGSDDYLAEVTGDEEQELFAVQFHRLHLRLDHGPPRSLGREAAARWAKVRTGVTLGYDRSGLGEEGVMVTHGLGLRTDAELPLHRAVRLRGGALLQIDGHEFEAEGYTPPTEPDDPEAEPVDDGRISFDVGDAFVSNRTHELGAYADLVIRPLDELEIVPGLRTDLYAEGELSQASVDPRGTVRIRPLPWLTSVSGFGVAHQRPALIVAVPGLDPQALDGGLQEVVQLSQGAELSLWEEIEAKVTGFVHWYHNLTDLSATCAVGTGRCTIGQRADGRAYGVEVMVRRSLTERFGGLVSYTLSRAERTAQDRTTFADFDRTHVFHLALSAALGAGWHAGARLTAYSGRPYSLLSFDDREDPNVATMVGRRNALRRGPFHRIDARLEKRWRIDDVAWVSLVFEGLNVTARKEIIDFDCRVAEALGGRGGLQCGGQEIGPITIPSIGVSGGF